jgi:DNA-binding MarR family transcriptional regulator
MPRTREEDDSPQWLTPAEQRAWVAWMRVSLRLEYEINRDLQEDSGLSHSDYHVLVALNGAAGGRLQLSALADTIGWERSRLSHHLQRMTTRGLTRRVPSAVDGRATDAVLTAAGRRALERAALPHAETVHRLFFGGLDDDELPLLAGMLERVYASLLEQGTLPPPPGPSA